jgi:hypothetical protein
MAENIPTQAHEKSIAPAAPKTKLGADGEPIPAGNDAQRKAAEAAAATVPKAKKAEVKKEQAHLAEKPMENNPQIQNPVPPPK